MAKISVSLNSTEVATGKKLQKTLTDINAAATSAQIKTFTQALNNLTTNNYIETNRIEKTNVDTEEAPRQGKETPILTLGTWTEEDGQYYAPIVYSGDVSTVKLAYRQRVTQNNTVEIMDYEDIGKVVYGMANINAVLYVAETPNYTAAFFEFTSNQ